MKRLWAEVKRRPETQIIGIFVLAAIVLKLIYPNATVTAEQVLAGASINGVVALGLTVVILQGAFDLSVGPTLALGAIIAIDTDGWALLLRLAAVIGAGVVVGLVNGLVVTRLRINSLIATIATMFVVQGIDYLVTNSAPIEGASVQGAINFVTPITWILSPEILMFVGAAILVHLCLSVTRVGREMYAIGGNQEAAKAAGIPVDRRIVMGFIVSGSFAAFAGYMTAVQLDAANPNFGSGQGGSLALVGITAVVIGGTSLMGGVGTALGTAMGALLLALISTVFGAVGLSATYEDVAYGSILLTVILAQQFSLIYPAFVRYFGRRRSSFRKEAVLR